MFFSVRLQYGVAKLCNQLLQEFYGNLFETLHRCYTHIENVHVTLCWQKKIFLTKLDLQHFWLSSFEVRFQYGIASCFTNFSQSFWAFNLILCTNITSINNFWQNHSIVDCDISDITVKILKFGTPQTIVIIVLKIEKFDVALIALMHPKDADGMANSVDPDQTASLEAVWSWSALFAETYLSQYIEFVR